LTRKMLGYSDSNQFTCSVYNNLNYNHFYMVCIFIASIGKNLSSVI
jgi:hypothetical protein